MAWPRVEGMVEEGSQLYYCLLDNGENEWVPRNTRVLPKLLLFLTK